MLTLSLGFGITADSARQTPRYVELAILHTNDVHGRLMPFEGDGDANVGGIARRASLINLVRWESDCPVLVLDAGDMFPSDETAFSSREPMLAAMSAMGYDAAGIGGSDLKAEARLVGGTAPIRPMAGAKFPVVCANAIDKSTGKPVASPYVVLERQGVRIAVFGLTDSEAPDGLEVADPIQTAKALVPQLKQEADVIVALTHIGYEMDKLLAVEVPEIDVIVGGGSHTWLERPEVVSDGEQYAFWVGGPVICQDGEYGKCVGKLSLILRRQGDHDYQVMSYRGELLPVNDSIEASSDVERIIKRLVKD
jgi:2',3'-cyclic-nucleotide 2'-phosphodiesterase (5'-nucleotidase family)